MSISATSSIQPGWDVVGSDGDKVGDVAEIGPNYILVTKGIIFITDLYIPTSAVGNVEDGKVYLNVPKDQVETMGWDQPPSGEWTSDAEGLPSAGTSDMSADTDTMTATQSAPVYETTTTEMTTAQPVDTDSTRVQRVEEELSAQKVAREAGEVSIRKDVVQEQQTLEVPVMREEVQVTSRVVDRAADAATDAFSESEIRVPVREEEVQVTKDARVVEELEVQKVATQDVERVSDTVRKERVYVEETGDVDVQQTGGIQSSGSSTTQR